MARLRLLTVDIDTPPLGEFRPGGRLCHEAGYFSSAAGERPGIKFAVSGRRFAWQRDLAAQGLARFFGFGTGDFFAFAFGGFFGFALGNSYSQVANSVPSSFQE